jgi:hypothetical protein
VQWAKKRLWATTRFGSKIMTIRPLGMFGLGLTIAFWSAAAGWANGPGKAAPSAAPASQPVRAVNKQAIDWLIRARDELANIKDVREQGAAGWQIVRLFATAGDEQAARELANLLVARPHRWYFEEVLAGVHARAGDFAGARKFAAKIEDEESRATALIDVLQEMALAGDIKGAREVADEFGNVQWRARAYGEIAGAQARRGEFAEARATAKNMFEKNSEEIDKDREPVASGPKTEPGPDLTPRAKENSKAVAAMRDKILAAVTEMQGLAGDLAGAKETAASIKDEMLADLAKTYAEDSEPEAKFNRAWQKLAASKQFPIPPAESLRPEGGGLLFDYLGQAITAADPAGYDKAIASAADVAARMRPRQRQPRRWRDTTGGWHTDPLLIPRDATVLPRSLAYTCIAVVEAAHGDDKGAKSMITRALATGEQEKQNDLFTGTCGTVLAAMQIKLGDIDPAINYALSLQQGHAMGIHVARIVGYTLVSEGKVKQLNDDYLSKVVEPSHRVYARIGVASAYLDLGKK